MMRNDLYTRPVRLPAAASALLRSILAIGVAWSALACDDTGGDLPGDTVDLSRPDAYVDPCLGVSQCALDGTFCNGDTLTTCGPDNNGCLVRTDEVDCAQLGQTCDPSAGACVGPSACDGLDLCADGAPALACDGDTLVSCETNADGCLVATRTACGDVGATCDDSDAAPRCAGGATDVCAGKDLCASPGRSCDGNFLETCSFDAQGCLVANRFSCGSATCTTNGAVTICQSEGACDEVERCSPIGRTCDGGILTVCQLDQRGCQAATQVDCADVEFGFGYCDAQSEVVKCAVSATDPCESLETCDSEGTSCDGTELVTCATDEALGCIVASRTDCADAGGTCGDDGAGPACADACSLVDECPAETWCDGDALVTCSANEFGCLVETGRSTCAAGQTCDAVAGACIDSLCPQRAAELVCNTSNVSGDTSTGQSRISDFCGSMGTRYPSSEAIYELRATGDQIVEVTASGFTVDADLFATAGTDVPCDTAAFDTCLDDSALGGTNDETVGFLLADGETAYVAVDVWDSTDTTPFGLSVTCTDPAVGGNGDTCATAIPLTEGIHQYSSAGLANDYDTYGGSCGENGDGADMVFAVQVPPNTTIDVILTPLGGQDTVLVLSTGCPQVENSCQASDDALFSDEQAAYTNNTGATRTVYVVVDGYFASDEGSFELDILFL